MHTTINYNKSSAPSFDACEDIREWLGDKYDIVRDEMAKVTHCGQFALYCSLAGISGFPVKAWYEHFHGEGSWKQDEYDQLL